MYIVGPQVLHPIVTDAVKEAEGGGANAIAMVEVLGGATLSVLRVWCFLTLTREKEQMVSVIISPW